MPRIKKPSIPITKQLVRFDRWELLKEIVDNLWIGLSSGLDGANVLFLGTASLTISYKLKAVDTTHAYETHDDIVMKSHAL